VTLSQPQTGARVAGGFEPTATQVPSLQFFAEQYVPLGQALFLSFHLQGCGVTEASSLAASAGSGHV
jgi:hypothetical protein